MSDINYSEFAGILSDIDIKNAMRNSELVIYPFDEKKLTPLGYNLSFTKFIFSINHNILYEIKFDNKTNELYCEIEPNDCVLILTQEAIWISEKYMGTFHSKVGIVSKGFGHISTTLDPNWEGPLLISLNNPTKNKIKIVIGKDESQGVKYNTFVTLVFYKMISEAHRHQDNLPSRIEILKDKKDLLINSKKYKELIEIIDEIRNFESVQVNIGKYNKEERKQKIKQFKDKYSMFMPILNSNIHTASKISKSIIKNNLFIYYSLLVVSFVIMLIIWLYFVVKAYNSKDSNMVTIIVAILSLIPYIFGLVEKFMRNKFL